MKQSRVACIAVDLNFKTAGSTYTIHGFISDLISTNILLTQITEQFKGLAHKFYQVIYKN
ncbi:hypothetical protein [uncultured Draconibacterium sp.]|uniref:hypothetical protein n=1 Tax=uncultured Draconibacterium sp. TaxID=1573823 RepID=UPI003216F6E5